MFLLDDTGILYYGTSYMNSQLDLGKKTADKNISQGRRFVKEFDRNTFQVRGTAVGVQVQIYTVLLILTSCIKNTGK